MTNQQAALLLMNLRARLWAERESLRNMFLEIERVTEHTTQVHIGGYTPECTSAFTCKLPEHYESIGMGVTAPLDGLDAFIADLDAQIELLKTPNTIAVY